MALTAIGKENLSDVHITIISKRLSESEKTMLLRETQHTPAWMHKAVKRICEDVSSKDKNGK